MSTKMKAVFFSVLMAPAMAFATDFEHDALSNDIYALTPEVMELKSDGMMANINRTIDAEPTAAGNRQSSDLFGFEGHDLNDTY